MAILLYNYAAKWLTEVQHHKIYWFQSVKLCHYLGLSTSISLAQLRPSNLTNVLHWHMLE